MLLNDGIYIKSIKVWISTFSFNEDLIWRYETFIKLNWLLISVPSDLISIIKLSLSHIFLYLSKLQNLSNISIKLLLVKIKFFSKSEIKAESVFNIQILYILYTF